MLQEVLPFSGAIQTRVLYREDNLIQLAEFPDECIDLIYLDPPFFSNRVYEVIWGDEAEIRSFEDRWEGGMQHYVGWMHERVSQMHRVLKSSGSLYLHCDPHASHYLKVMLDQVFGSAKFRSEVIWKRTNAHSSAKRWGPVHDTILFYTKSGNWTWNKVLQPLPKETADSWYNKVEAGRRLNYADLTAPGVRQGSSGLTWRGVDPTSKGRHWAIPGFVRQLVPSLPHNTQEALDALDEMGRLHWPQKKNGVPMLKRYLEEAVGIPALDVVTDVERIPRNAAERIGYPTQKPEALLERIIRASSNEDDIVLDPFCGCGTTVVTAERLKRNWIGIDISPTAMEIMRRRLLKAGAPRPIIEKE